MHSYPIKKFFSLLLLYAVIIVGIFIFQFRSESVISKNSGSLHITLAESVDNGNQKKLKNTFKAVFNGLTIFADDKNPAVITYNNDIHKLTLISWQQASPQSYIFTFSDNVILNLSVITDENKNEKLFISADLPENAESFSINYKPVRGYTVTKQDQNSIVFDSYNKTYQLMTNFLEIGKISLRGGQNSAVYAAFEKNKKISLDSIGDLPEASEDTYKKTIRNYLDSIISVYTKNISTLDEQSATVYIAEMARRGKYNEALDSVPETLKKITAHSYISAPFFDTLAETEEGLESHIQEMQSLIEDTVTKGSLEIFTQSEAPDYIVQNSKAKDIIRMFSALVQLPNFNPTLLQATEILQTYTGLLTTDTDTALKLEPAIEKCTEIMFNSLSLKGNTILVTDNEINVPVVQAAQTGAALIAYGTAVNNITMKNCGYLIINTYIAQSASFGENTLALLYPILMPDNTYYPHYLRITDKIWAWTCAKDIKASTDSTGTITLDIDFPQGLTHYLIVGGIKKFTAIQIYGLDFHTDPRFETYNSSGYAHIDDRNILLLKSRHKAQHEIIKIFYTPVPASVASPDNTATAQ